MPSEIDINLIFLRLEKLEERIKVLEADKLKPDDYYQVKAQVATQMGINSTTSYIPQWEEGLK